MLLSNCSVFDAFPDASPDLFYLSPKAGNGDYLVPRIFNKNMSPTQPFPKLLILPFNAGFGCCDADVPPT